MNFQTACNNWHKHLDTCIWCQEHPYDLCKESKELLKQTNNFKGIEKVVISDSCRKGNCGCKIYDEADPNVVGFPPFHKECSCYIIEEIK